MCAFLFILHHVIYVCVFLCEDVFIVFVQCLAVEESRLVVGPSMTIVCMCVYEYDLMFILQLPFVA